MLEQRIQQQFFDSADLNYAAAEVLAKPIADAAAALVGCITAGGRVLVAGSGGSAAVAQLVVAGFVGRFERERPGLAAVGLTNDSSILAALGRDDDLDGILARQVLALGQPGDVLIVIGTGTEAPELLAAVDAAHARELTVVALTGRHGGALRARLTEADVLIAAPHDRAARVQEVHLLTVHCLCDAVDLQLLGEQDAP